MPVVSRRVLAVCSLWFFAAVAIADAAEPPPKPQSASAKSQSISLGEKESDARVQAEGKDWRLQKARIVDKSRPRVLLIGDSILNGYLDGVTKELDGAAYLDAWVTPTNQGNKALPKVIGEVLAHGPYDVIHFNLGLHGWQPGRIPEGQFEPLTAAMVQAFRKHAPQAKLIWASTTPVTKLKEPGTLDAEVNPIIVEHNRMAAKVMAAENVPIDNLYGLMLMHLDLAAGDRFHWKPEARALQAKQVADAVRGALGQVQPVKSERDELAPADKNDGAPVLKGTPLGFSFSSRQFEGGDVVCFVGDSITRGGWYHSFIRQFYLTRYPERKIAMFNCGHSGDVAPGVLKRLSWDVLEHKPTQAVVMLGMNDAPVELARQFPAAENYAKLVDALLQAKCHVTLVEPSIYEERAELEKAPNVGKNDALAGFGREIARIARERQTNLVVLHGPMNDLNLAMQKRDPKFTLVGADRVHPGEVGHFVMAAAILNYQEVTGVVSQIEIAADTAKIVEQKNCRAADFVQNFDTLCFTCVENALPFVPTEKSQPAVALTDFQERLNVERLTVTGLADGKYVLSIDDKEVGEYDADELFKGINLAGNEKTPQYQQSAKITKLNARRHDIESIQLRGVSFVRYKFLEPAGINPNDKPAIEAKLKAVLAEGLEGFGRTMVERYLEQWGPNYEKNLKLITELDAEIEELRKPQPHRWKLVRR